MRETQALHLENVMQKHIHYTKYEVALPLMKVHRSTLKNLSMYDVFLLKLNVFECIMIEEDNICARLQLKRYEGSYALTIIQTDQERIVSDKHPKRKIIKFSFGTYPMKHLAIGESLRIEDFDTEKVVLIVDKKKIAEGILMSVENEIAVKVSRVL